MRLEVVGLAAVLVAIAAYYSQVISISNFQNIKTASIIEMGLGVSIGAITFNDY